jgi:dynein light chain Tctex-type 1
VGAGLHTAVSALWDPSTDGKACVVWESQTLTVVTTVFYMLL